MKWNEKKNIVEKSYEKPKGYLDYLIESKYDKNLKLQITSKWKNPYFRKEFNLTREDD